MKEHYYESNEDQKNKTHKHCLNCQKGKICLDFESRLDFNNAWTCVNYEEQKR